MFFSLPLPYITIRHIMLRKIRLACGLVFFVLITGLFLDFTGTLRTWLWWLAKIQFLPAVLALNAGVVIFLVVLTLVFGRIYCSVVCPLGVFQDAASWIGGRSKKGKYRFSYSPAKPWLRCTVLALFAAAAVAGIGSLVALLAPYSSYGRIVQNLFAPVYGGINNLLAYLAERTDSYAFYERDVWVRSLPTFAVAAATFVVVAALAWRNGRTYCNTVCPVGTVLGFLARFSWFKIRINEDKCNKCGLCSKSCKASCIDHNSHKVDYSRCVVCGNCIGNCRKQAIGYSHGHKTTLQTGQAAQTADNAKVDTARRTFLLGAALATASATLAQEKKKVDGGLAKIEEKAVPERSTPITPPGSFSAENMARHCTACQLCVAVCPNDVLRPSTDIMKLMQPAMSYERGYCRPECTKCSEVCPTGAISPISCADKSATQIGHAVWIKKNCIPLTDGVECGNCARHCPSGAIIMIPSDASDPGSPKIPAVNTQRCIGCGACENLCPARPLSAIYVEGHEMHRIV